MIGTQQSTQTTQYVYGVSQPTSAINSNDILAAVNHPDPGNGQPTVDSHTVNALGETTTATDRNGNVHTYSYDVLGRLIADAVTQLGSGVDNAVQRIEIAYDTGGRPYLYTSFDARSGGNIVNQVRQNYNGLGQLITEYQSHSGVVNPIATPSVQYGYSQVGPGQNNSRLVSMTYPNGRQLSYNYNSGVDNSISRLTSISDSTATLESYKYLGLNTVVERDHPQNKVNLTYIMPPNGIIGDAGDKYTGLDRFGRVVDQNWVNTNVTPNTTTDRFQYGYDRNGNVLYKNNLVDIALSELYHASGAGNGYDQLNQLTGFVRSALTSSSGNQLDTVANPTTTESWSLDALGNWSSVTANGVTQNRSVNQQNEVTAAGTQSLSYDANGNTLVDDRGQHYTYDAWNRLVKVTTGGGTTLAMYSYDALGRRIVENEVVARDLYYSAAWQVLEERISGQPRVQYVWSAVYVDALVERDNDRNNNGTFIERLYVQQDANWNVTALVDPTGTVVERYFYDPYGQPTVLNPDGTTRSASYYSWNYLHQGGRFDWTTGLYNFRNRDYSPTLGRWMQNDSLGFAAGDSNLYRTEGNNLPNGSDPTGWAAESGLAGQAWDPLDSPSASDMIARAEQATELEKQVAAMAKARERSNWNPFKGIYVDRYFEDPSEKELELAREARRLRDPRYVRGSNGWQLTKRWQERADQDLARAKARERAKEAYYWYLIDKGKRREKLTGDEIMWREGYKEGGNPGLRTPGQVGDIDPIEVIASLGAGGTCKPPVSTPSSALARLRSPRASLLNRASDSRLRDAIDKLYRSNARVGSGSSMDALRFERATDNYCHPLDTLRSYSTVERS